MDSSSNKTAYRDIMNYIEFELAVVLNNTNIPPPPQIGRISRQLKHFPIPPEVTIVKDEKGNHVLSLIAGDRPGLLARIAYFLAQHQIELHRAKVNTLGSRAEDTFWISAQYLDSDHRIENLCTELKAQLK
jgi:[protein-PII] uridylyltransferase